MITYLCFTMFVKLGYIRRCIQENVSSLALKLQQQHGDQIIDDLDIIYDDVANAEIDELELDPRVADHLRALIPRVRATFGDEAYQNLSVAIGAIEQADLATAVKQIGRVIGGAHENLHGDEDLEWLLSKSSEDIAQHRRSSFRIV